MASCSNSADRGNFTFGEAFSGFLSSPGLPFAERFCEHRTADVLKSTKDSLVVPTLPRLCCALGCHERGTARWQGSLLSKCCRSSQQLLPGHALGDIALDTRGYCRARAKLSKGATHEMTTQNAK
ncbi:hypothetical protein Q31a_22840 [Aureliella helgolandensis]|uniref:Uncharacterized protein n=1 Tax=Aureliella helgolandensis TaxID=2527968 RepID=A0A518G5V3_9BACT|nr:hypothetical protein Q31a_22840 [Aureliella helgolandensis]